MRPGSRRGTFGTRVNRPSIGVSYIRVCGIFSWRIGIGAFTITSQSRPRGRLLRLLYYSAHVLLRDYGCTPFAKSVVLVLIAEVNAVNALCGVWLVKLVSSGALTHQPCVKSGWCA